MVSVDNVVLSLASIPFLGCCGVDAVGLSGGLFIFWLAPFSVVLVFISPNFVVCKIEVGDVIKFVIFVYGAPHVADRSDRLNLGLVTVPFSGPSYTWTNNRIEVDPTFERLDKAYATQDWFIDYPDSIVHHQPILFSDHTTIIFSDSLPQDSVRRPYRIENWCLSAQDTSRIIKDGCRLEFTGSPCFTLSRRLVVIRRRLKDWCLSHKKSWGINWKALCSDLSSSSTQLQSPVARDAGGESHSKLLFSVVQARRRRNLIVSLKNDAGIWVSDSLGLRSLIQAFYSDLYSHVSPFGSDPPFSWDHLGLPTLSSSQKDMLMAPFSPSEIKAAMFHISNDKSPGPDGFTSAFFNTHWDHTGHLVISAVQYFFAHAKCITGRLRGVLPSLISGFQNAFVPGRLISDNALVAHELLSFMNASKARKRFYAALKLDMNKAYDRVRWDFLSQVLRAFGFPPYSVHIIEQCVTTVSYQVLVNGSLTPSFRPQCCLRQGDPLSPYLFVLCMEVLSTSLRRAEEQALFSGIRVSRGGPSISHLFFADDSLLFFQLSPQACDNVMAILSDFCSASGQMINLQKSFVKFSPNTPQDYRDFLARSLRLQSKASFGTHLGLPVDLGRSKVAEFRFLIDKVASRLSAFASLRLLAAAKLAIINSVLIASFNHILSVFKIPSSVASQLDSMLANFWWRSSGSRKGLALRSVSLLHLPKGLGGLGVRNIACFNSAILAGTGWRMIRNPQLLVSRLMFLKYPSLPVNLGARISRPSWGCRGLQMALSAVSSGVRWKVGRGDKSDLPTHVSGIIDPRSNAWDSSRVHRFFDSPTAVRILSLDRPQELMDDFVYWKFTKDGSFSTKSAYALLLHQTIRCPPLGSLPIPWWKKFWALPLLPKWKIFGWKIIHAGIPVASALAVRGVSVDSTCCFCRREQETINHLFRDCDFVTPLWVRSSFHFNSQGLLHLPFLQWFSVMVSLLAAAKDWENLVQFFSLLWSIWLSRNNVRFRQQAVSPDDVLLLASQWNVRGRQAQDSHLPSSTLGPSPRPVGSGFAATLAGDPTSGFNICLICDGSWSSSDNSAGAGWVLRDCGSPSVRGGGARASLSSSALQSELQACFWGLRNAFSRGFRRILIYSDCEPLCRMLGQQQKDEVSLYWLLRDTRVLLSTCAACKILKVPREWVSPVHWLAGKARARECFFWYF
ncbi:uncharacterized protein LOC110723527 [Chenopodium quinoa]|uniref:uncharacterized protein LOC110723527 n=1 Tax=Chenopodium quinoa TaxID=63459 RepID=UPI000B78ADD7|nr:uncharacterized protein LOC110723527 [Chenopodium quinoa]